MKGWILIGVCTLAACGKSAEKQRIAGAQKANLDRLLFGLGMISEEQNAEFLAEAVAEECGKACACLAYAEVAGAGKDKLLRSCPKWTPLDADQAKLVDELAWIAVDVSGQYLADQVGKAGKRADELLEAMAAIAIPMPPAPGFGGVTLPKTTQMDTLPRAEQVVAIAADGKVRAGTMPVAKLTRDGAVLEAGKLADVADPSELAKLGAPVAAAAPPPPDDIADAEPPPAADLDTATALDEGKMGKKDSDRAEGQYKMKNNDLDPQLAREQALQAAKTAGILGSTAFVAPPQDQTSAVGQRWSALVDRGAVILVFADKAAPARTVGKVLTHAPRSVLAVENSGQVAILPLAFNAPSPAPDHIGMADDKVDLVIEVSADALVGYVTRIGESLGEFKFQGDQVDGAAVIQAITAQFGTVFFADRRDVVLAIKEDAKAAHLFAALDAASAAGASSVRVEDWTPELGHGAGDGTSSSPSDPKRPAGPTVRLGQPSGSGDLDKATIRRYIKRHIAQISYCYETELLVHPGLAGTVDTQFLIAPDGKVGEIHAKGVNDAVASCVAGVIKAIEFPKPKGGGPVNVTSYPFTFSAKPS